MAPLLRIPGGPSRANAVWSLQRTAAVTRATGTWRNGSWSATDCEPLALAAFRHGRRPCGLLSLKVTGDTERKPALRGYIRSWPATSDSDLYALSGSVTDASQTHGVREPSTTDALVDSLGVAKHGYILEARSKLEISPRSRIERSAKMVKNLDAKASTS